MVRLILAAMVTVVSLGAADAWAKAAPLPPSSEALASCTPGSSFDECGRKLEAAGVKLTPPKSPAGHREILLALRAPWELAQIVTEGAAAGRITVLRLQARMKPGKARREVFTWLDAHVKSPIRRDAVGNLGCGADTGGPAWFSSEQQAAERQPEVQYAIDRFNTLKGAAGRTMDQVVIDTPTAIEHLCFRLPRTRDGRWLDAAPLAASAAELIRSGPAKSRPAPR